MKRPHKRSDRVKQKNIVNIHSAMRRVSNERIQKKSMRLLEEEVNLIISDNEERELSFYGN